MARRRTICERVRRAPNADNDGYYALIEEVSSLPRALHSDGLEVSRGVAVWLARKWFWFPAVEPAAAFGRAGRMAPQVASWEIRHAAHEIEFCADHGTDHRALLLSTRVDRGDGAAMATYLTTFTQSVSENPQSSRWHGVRRR